MKKLVTITLLSLLIACKKEKDFKPSFNGKWSMISDTTRYIDVYKTSDTTVDITFPSKIDTPPQYQGAITLSYAMRVSGDTIYCTSGNIYPACFFINKVTYYEGYILEWNQGLDLGSIKQMQQK